MSAIDTARLRSLLPIRLAVGFGFLAHGLAKWNRGPEKFAKLLEVIGAPFPVPTAWGVTGIEIVGGIAILLGAFVLIASIPLIGTMVVAIATVHWRYGFSAINTIGVRPTGPIFGPPGYEVNLLYIAALLTLIVAGESTLSVDGWRRRRARKDASTSTVNDARKPRGHMLMTSRRNDA
jgi:putative oxidoreductase